MKNVFFIYAFIILLFIISCDSDSSDEATISDFSISISNVTTNSAHLNWTEPIVNNNIDITYSLYLNNALLDSNLTTLEYELLNLDTLSTYNIKIVALADNLFVEETGQFNTLGELFVSKIGENQFLYNDDKKLEFVDFPNEFTEAYEYRYEYNNEKLIHEHCQSPYYTNAGPDTCIANYIYENNILSEFEIKDCILHTIIYGGVESENITNSFIFDTNFTYSLIKSYTYNSADPYGNIDETVNFTGEFVYDTNGNVTLITKINTQTSQEFRYLFEYDDFGNITKMDIDGDILEIEYDNKKSYHKYYNGIELYYANSFKSDVLGLNFFPTDLKNKIRIFPILFNHKNKNNPIKYTYNNQIINVFSYEYNERNYPIKIIDENNSDEYLIDYIEL